MNKPEQLSLTVVNDRLCVDGVLDFTTAARMSPTLVECIAALPKSFTVDLSKLQSFNSVVLVFMLDCLRMSADSGKHCQFSGATAGLVNMLKMASLGELLGATTAAATD
jgi:ABC-type transporter Mla MlaB component